MHKRHYGLPTAITMIVGIVVGSGIFFRSDDVLGYTGGNVGLGVLVFCIAAFAIVFGCLTINNLAQISDAPGGALAYAGEFIGKRFGTAFGWFQTFIYYPALGVVVAWVVGIYVDLLFGLNLSMEGQMLVGFAWYVICFAYNIISPRFGGAFQNASTVIKLIPLILMGVLGIIFGQPLEALTHSVQAIEGGVSGGGIGWGWIAAIAPVAFSFDGWIISTSIAHEIRDSKKNLPIALVVGPLVILVLYLVYFVGISGFIGPDQVLALGDASVYEAATRLLGNWGARIILTFVVISVMGTVNGIVLGFIRLPYSLAVQGHLPFSKTIAKTFGKADMPYWSGLFAFLLGLFWWLVHLFTMELNLLGNSNVSDIAIAMSYFLYIALYFKVHALYKKGTVKGKINGILFPILATLGSLFIVVGSMQNEFFIIFALICLIPMIAGFFFLKKHHEI